MSLTQEHIDFFKLNGYVIIENILSPIEIETARNDLHESLKNIGINHDNIINGLEEVPTDCRIKSEISNIFYAKWKIDLQINEQMYLIWKELINQTITELPFGPHNDILPYIDRICWRLPDVLRQEGGLGLHLDRRPGINGLTSIKKYRPIQGFISLTDHYGSESGGLKIVKGFHKIFNEYFDKNSEINFETSGEFFRMHDKSHLKLQKICEAINVPAGSLVLWDNRLPHATCEKLCGFDSREVVYLSYIPNVPLNIKYFNDQKENFIKNIQPPSYLKDINKKVDRNYEINELNDWQKKILLSIK